jgi:archaellum component FlaC
VAGEGKKLMKAELKAYPLAEMKKEDRDFIEGDKVLKKKFGPITFSEKLELDPRKWSEKKLSASLGMVARYEMKLLATAVHQAREMGDEKKSQNAALKAYDRISKMVLEKVSDALEELRNDSGDNKKALKEGKDLFGDLDRINWGGLFSKPAASVQGALVALLKTAPKAQENPAGFRKAQLAAQKTVKGEMGAFEKAAAEVAEALTQFDKLYKELRKNDDVAPELKEFGNILHKHEKTLDAVQGECRTFAKALEDVDKGLEPDELDEDAVKSIYIAFRSISGPDKAARAAAAVTKKLKPQFLALKKKLT